MPETSDLRAVQQWLRVVLTCPDGALTGVESPQAAELGLGLDPAKLGALIDSTPGFSAAQRLDSYQRSHQHRLRDVVRSFYPALRHLLGEELFDDFALEYLRVTPSRAFSLRPLGTGFADYLSSEAPEDDWAGFVVDLARLERLFAEVYDGPGGEGSALLAGDDPRLDMATDGRLVPVCCLHLITTSFPAGDYLQAVRQGHEPEFPSPCPSFLMVNRRDWVVTVTALTATEYRLLDQLVRGTGMRTAARTAGLLEGVAHELIRGWADGGCFSAFWPATAAPRSVPADTPFRQEYATS